MKILVVDNDKLILEFMSDILSKEGHQVLTAGDGLSALDVLRTHTPDVIFTDLVMPNIDGKRLCKIVRSVPQLGDVYLAVLTSVAAEAEVDIAELKADACIAKGPFKEMAKTVFAVLDQPELASSRCLSGEVIGIEKVHRRRISMELLSLVKHLESILGSMSEGILEIGPEQKIVYANPAALSLTGITEERLMGSPFLDLFSEDDQKRLINTLKSKGDMPTGIIGEDDPLILNDYLVTVDILTLKEDLSSIVIVISDVTERKRTEKELEKHREHLEELVDERIAEIKKINEQLKNEIIERQQAKEALKESEERYRTILDSIEETYFEVDIAGNFTFFNDSLSKTLGYSNDELAGMNNRDYMSPESSKKIYDLFNQIYNTGNPIKKVVYEIIRKDGGHGFHELSASLMKDQAGRPIGFRGIAHDITERTKAEEALQENEERLRILFEFAPDAFYLNDAEGTLLDGNKAAEKLIGYKKHELIGENFLTLGILVPGQIQKAAEVLAKNVMGEATGPDEFTLNRKDGSQVIVEISTFPVRTKKERLVLGIARDITRRLEAEEEILQREKLQTMIEMATAVCHEMNQPMQVVSGYSGLLLAGMTEDDPRYEDIKEISRQVGKMAVITTNLQNITTYKTRTYIKGRNMVDIDESSR